MAEAYWRYSDSRQQASATLQLPVAKRLRSDYDVPSGHELSNYYAREDERVSHRVIRDTDPIGASYDRYLRSSQLSSYSGGESARSMSNGLGGHPVDDPRIVGMGGSDLAMSTKSRSMGVGGGRSELPLPPDASSTLFVEGLPANCTRREVSHIFRPFVGYKEVRLVTKDSRHPGGEPLVLCFVDFASPAYAATAMDALQDKLNLAGYKFDEHDRDSVRLRLQFARYPGARSGGGHRGKR
ncbi:RNA-binding protein 2-like isoform X1 [Coffea eugenioides]|uniref:RNA-binding protein 2-like isoform X1 n=1 Tax=Coffea arabica TaxID=13443 RepID=A0A6P6W3K6_COFAR|nr:RNA-binding protein 2-like isoform X1 [Coffea arabica]XP_027160934.1 RNA-binding protein 2-like isoform X1 [Coffea eugenioides]XP_027160935.1 RNA-binding protein 2-like isoform X1 [Coffea eugenioides]